MSRFLFCLFGCIFLGARGAGAQVPKDTPGAYSIPPFTKEEEAVVARLQAVNVIPVEERGPLLEDLAVEIRGLPKSFNKLRLADAVAFAARVGDPGPYALKEAADGLADALREQPGKLDAAYLDSAYKDLAYLIHYERMKVSLDDPKLAVALSLMDADDKLRAAADFTLQDLTGRKWALKAQRGKVVVVFFWAGVMPACRQELLDLEFFCERFQKQGLTVLAVTSDHPETVINMIQVREPPFPILLDPDGKAGRQYRIVGLPKTFVYDRNGKLVAQGLDVRSRQQLGQMLAAAGLK